MKSKSKSAWGGVREGAGRKNRSGQVNHMARAVIGPRKQLHIIQRMKAGMPSLKSAALQQPLRQALDKAEAFDVRILKHNVAADQIELVVRAKDNEALGLGMRSLFSSLAKQVKKVKRINGPVFDGRYRMKVVARS